MNRHDDDESTGHSSQSSRHSSRLFKYDDITILIEALTGQQYELKCSPNENILSIKGRLARLEGISANQQHIIYLGKLLDDRSVLKDVGVKNFSKLRLVTQMRGGPVNTRVIDDDQEESDAEIALVVLKDGERVSLVRFPLTGSLYQGDYDSDQFRHFINRHPTQQRPKSRDVAKTRQITEDNKKTEDKMDEIRKKMKQKKPKLPDMRQPRNALPPINSNRYSINDSKSDAIKFPVPNSHSHFLQKYGLKQTKSPLSEEIVSSILPSVKKTRPRCKKCGKRLGLTEQYRCRCGDQYCTRHRYAEEHDCNFDYQKDHKAKLRNQKHNVQPPKLPKI